MSRIPVIKIETDDDRRWLYDGRDREWTLPSSAWWPWRLWGVRHVRAVVKANRVARWDSIWRELGLIPSGYDRWVIYAILRGWI